MVNADSGRPQRGIIRLKNSLQFVTQALFDRLGSSGSELFNGCVLYLGLRHNRFSTQGVIDLHCFFMVNGRR